MRYLAGIDAGTTAIKGVLFSEEGQTIAQGISEYKLETPKGVFYGIFLNHSKDHFIRAILEGVSFMLKKNLDIMEELG